LAPHLAGATGRADLDALDVAALLRGQLHPVRSAELDRLAPATYPLPGGRHLAIDYGSDPPALAVRVQALFGVTEHPSVAGGRVALVLHLLSPADRPVQVTSDLAGFWTGSWHDVRRDMAGRYPKHDWPEDPGAAGRRSS
jgi:ATP-dependent helicase HrpB